MKLFALALLLLLHSALAEQQHHALRLDTNNTKKEKATRTLEVGERQPVEASADDDAAAPQQCVIAPDSAQGACARPSSLRFIVNSCGDIYGPTVVERALEASGHDLTNNLTKQHWSEAWSYMASLNPDDVFLMGDNVYSDNIHNWGKDKHPFGVNLANVLADANIPFLKYHGFLTQDEQPGPLFYSYLELMKDKLNDGFIANDEFQALRKQTHNSIHAMWDDHDYLTDDASNPHFLRNLVRKHEIEALTGWDRKYFRFGAAHKGIERTWTKELTDNNGNPFLVRFIVLDEESTHNATQGCTYYADPNSSSGFVPRKSTNSSAFCPDVDVMEDFEQAEPIRRYFGDDQLQWFRQQLEKPADLIFVTTGGPNFEHDYPEGSLFEYPSEKRKFIEILRETGVEHLIFLTGDSHGTYLTKAPHLCGYPLYTIVGSGLTRGFSYDRYITNYGDVSHRFVVAAGSTLEEKAAATFAEVNVLFDDDGAFVRFTPHFKRGNTQSVYDGWTGEWYAQTEANPNEPWDAQYDIRVSELEISSDWPRYHYDSTIPHKHLTEGFLVKWANTTGPAEDLSVTLTITNAAGETKSFDLAHGSNCGTGFFGFCKDQWGAYAYTALKIGDYVHSKVLQEICEHAGYAGDEIQWSIEENGEQVISDTYGPLKIRNNVLVNAADGGELDELEFYGSAEAYVPLKGKDSVGVPVTEIINAPEFYGGYKVPVKGYDSDTDQFDDPDVQAEYSSWQEAAAASSVSKQGDDEDAAAADTASLMAVYLSTYYPDAPQMYKR